MAVYSIEELEKLVGTDLGDEDKAAIREIESDAVDMVEEVTNRRLDSSTTVTELRSGNGTRRLDLYNDTSSVTSVEYRVGDTWTTVNSTEYAVYDDNKLMSFGIRWPHGEWNMRITYTAGYNDPRTIPRDLRKAVGEIVLGKWREARNGEEFVMSDDTRKALARWTVKNFVPQPRLVRG